jgi:hypothetical protein
VAGRVPRQSVLGASCRECFPLLVHSKIQNPQSSIGNPIFFFRSQASAFKFLISFFSPTDHFSLLLPDIKTFGLSDFFSSSSLPLITDHFSLFPMPRVPKIAIFLALALAAVEGLAYWWTHPAASSVARPILTYRLSSLNHSITSLPEIYNQASSMLRCSNGQVFHATLDDNIGIHFAYFEWDDTDTGSVLEAFRHMPEACMGSLGMKLIAHEKPIAYTVREDETGDSSPNAATSLSHFNQKSKIDNHQSSISPSSSSHLASATLIFDHTTFSEAVANGAPIPSTLPIHAFRAVWVDSMQTADARKGLDGEKMDSLRAIRLKSALTRFRPQHARVIQGAVRGAPSGEAAWEAFEKAMLADLNYVTQ